MKADQKADLERFAAFRAEHGLSLDPRLVPEMWDNLPDLEHRYWRAEATAKEAAKIEAAKTAKAAPSAMEQRIRRLESMLSGGAKAPASKAKHAALKGKKKTKTVVTRHDEKGRIAEFEQQEVEACAEPGDGGEPLDPQEVDAAIASAQNFIAEIFAQAMEAGGVRLALEVMLADVYTLFRYARAQRLKLEGRIAELEGRKALHDAEVWRKDKTYNAGAVVSDRGSAWAATSRSENIRPGDGSRGIWRLMVKRGKDAT